MVLDLYEFTGLGTCLQVTTGTTEVMCNVIRRQDTSPFIKSSYNLCLTEQPSRFPIRGVVKCF